MNTVQIQGLRVWVLLVLAVVCFAVCPVKVQAEEGSSEKGSHRAMWQEKKEAMFEQLGLTEEQKAQLEKNKENKHAQMDELRQKIHDKKEQVRMELQKSDFDAGKVREIHQELKDLKNQKEDLRLQGILEVRKVLTTEQFQKFTEMKHARMQKGSMGHKMNGTMESHEGHHEE